MNERIGSIMIVLLISMMGATPAVALTLKGVAGASRHLDIPALFEHQQPATNTSLMFPITTHFPGGANPTKIALKLLLPNALCVIDASGLSATWVGQHVRDLRKLKAMCIVTNVQRLSQLEQIKAVMPGVPLIPCSAQELVTNWGIRSIPVLITRTGVVLQ
jgi:integrating conjugative element protein (TIGR03765 family)